MNTPRNAHIARLRELAALQDFRPLTQPELYEAAGRLRALGRVQDAERAERAAAVAASAPEPELPGPDSAPPRSPGTVIHEAIEQRVTIAPRAPRPQQPSLAGVAVTLVLGLVVWALLASNAGPLFKAVATATAPVEHTLRYRAWGVKDTVASITYSTPDGGQEQRQVALPWRSDAYTFTGQPILYASAQAAGERAVVTVDVWVDGEQWRTATSTGDYCIATASGWYGME